MNTSADTHKNIVENLNLVTVINGLTEMDYVALKELTSDEFVEAVKTDFEKMNDLPDFRCEVKKVTRNHLGKNYYDHIYVCIGHFIYSHIHQYCLGNGHIDMRIFNQEYFKEVVEPFMNKIKNR